MPKQSILKWGNSLGFRLPSEVAKQLKVCEGTEVSYTLSGSQLIIEPVTDDLPSFTLADLRRAARRVRPRLVSFGKPRGKEVW